MTDDLERAASTADDGDAATGSSAGDAVAVEATDADPTAGRAPGPRSRRLFPDLLGDSGD